MSDQNNSSAVDEVAEVASDVIKTAEDPSPTNLLDDLETAIKLVKQLKVVMKDAHPSVVKLVRKLLF